MGSLFIVIFSIWAPIFTTAKCQYWCSSTTDRTWEVKCKWNVCDSCSECGDRVTCNDWCASHPDDWQTKCAMPSGDCGSCKECSDQSSTDSIAVTTLAVPAQGTVDVITTTITPTPSTQTITAVPTDTTTVTTTTPDALISKSTTVSSATTTTTTTSVASTRVAKARGGSPFSIENFWSELSDGDNRDVALFVLLIGIISFVLVIGAVVAFAYMMKFVFCKKKRERDTTRQRDSTRHRVNARHRDNVRHRDNTSNRDNATNRDHARRQPTLTRQNSLSTADSVTDMTVFSAATEFTYKDDTVQTEHMENSTSKMGSFFGLQFSNHRYDDGAPSSMFV